MNSGEPIGEPMTGMRLNSPRVANGTPVRVEKTPGKEGISEVRRDATSLRSVLDALEQERTGADRFRGQSLNLGWRYLFGGQIVAQALAVAEQTVQEDPRRYVQTSFGCRASVGSTNRASRFDAQAQNFCIVTGPFDCIQMSFGIQ